MEFTVPKELNGILSVPDYDSTLMGVVVVVIVEKFYPICVKFDMEAKMC